MKALLGVAAGSLVGLIAGYAAFTGRSEPAAVTQSPRVCPSCPACGDTSAPVLAPSRAQDSGSTPQEKCATAERSVAELSQQLAVMDEQLRAVSHRLAAAEQDRQWRDGKPLQKPANLALRFEQAQMHRAFESALKEAGLNAQITSVDCTEYPCIVYGHGMGDRDDFRKLDQTKALDPYNPDGRWGWGWGVPQGDGGSIQYFGVTFLPGKTGPDAERDKRINYRVDEMKHATGAK